MKRSFLPVLVICTLLCCSPVFAVDSYGVAGSFNSWNPADPASQLKLADGLWSLETFLHAGVVEYKFTADHAWKVNWGDDKESDELPQNGAAVKGAGNIVCSLGKSGTYRFSFNPETGNYLLALIEASPDQPEPPQPPIPPELPPQTGSDFREETIYFLITTRFYDGDEKNNFYCRDRIKKGDPHWRGDFKGLIEKLDYLEDLGFTAIWITPPVENRSGLDYHGYHAYDWTKIDPRLESPGATYKDLIDACHKRNIKVIQDVVVNHSSNYGIRGQVWIDRLPVKYFRKPGLTLDWPYTGNLGNYQWKYRMDNDNPIAPEWFRERLNTDAEGVVPLLDPVTGKTVPDVNCNPNRFFGV
ncbi:MAG: alpha-amylase family glycosyl hydrolase, partial [Candidatus Rifleibacteriota bacterium]